MFSQNAVEEKPMWKKFIEPFLQCLEDKVCNNESNGKEAPGKDKDQPGCVLQRGAQWVQQGPANLCLIGITNDLSPTWVVIIIIIHFNIIMGIIMVFGRHHQDQDRYEDQHYQHQPSIASQSTSSSRRPLPPTGPASSLPTKPGLPESRTGSPPPQKHPLLSPGVRCD